MQTYRFVVLAILIAAIIGAILYLESEKVSAPNSKLEGEAKLTIMNKEEKAKLYEAAHEISSPDGFINTPSTSSGQATPITVGEHIGKNVILVDFWTYSCINCQRTLPYLNAWHKKYKDSGLVIIGVHTPEFEFEKEFVNVKSAVEKFGVNYPVVLDNDYSTWHAYNNRYWPRKYLIDIDGYIVYDHIGEGGYEETEKRIQELLEERMQVLGQSGEIDKKVSKPAGVEDVSADFPRSPEIYFGASRNTYLGNGPSNTAGVIVFKEPEGVKTNILYLDGSWDLTSEYAENKTEKAKIIFRYQAQKVFFVASSENGTEIQVLQDGKPVKNIQVKEDGLYRLIEDVQWGEHTLEIIINNSGLKAFTFTFG